MKGLTISDKEKRLLYIVLGVLVFFGVYWFVFRSAMEKNDEYVATQNQLQGEIGQLQQLVAREKEFTDGMDDMNQEMNTIFDSFPSMVTARDQIIYASNLEKAKDIKIQGVTLSDPTLAYTMNEDGSNPEDDGKLLYEVDTNYNCKVSYSGLKDVIRAINDTAKHKQVANISLVYDDETGAIGGNILLAEYYLEGTDKEYEAEKIPEVETGTSDIFGNTVEHLSDVKQADVTPADEENTDSEASE